MSVVFRTLALAALLQLTGCISYVSARQVEPTSKAGGLRYYLKVPLLVVEELPNGRFDARVEMVVDRSREFTVQPETFLAKSTATVEFNDDGTLKSFTLEQDTTDVPEAVVNALKDIQSKRIELEKSAIQKQLEELKEQQKAAEAAAKEKAEKEASSGRPAEKTETEEKSSDFRYAYVGRLEGPRVTSIGHATLLAPKVEPAAKGDGGVANRTGPYDTLRVNFDESSSTWVIKLPEGVQFDKTKFRFNNGDGKLLPDSELVEVQNQLQRQADGGFVKLAKEVVDKKRLSSVLLLRDGSDDCKGEFK